MPRGGRGHETLCPPLLGLDESASSPLVGFVEFNDNTIKGLTSLLSVEHEIEFIAYTCALWNEKCIQVQQEGKLDDMPYSVEMKAKLYIEILWKQSSSSKRQQCKWNQ